MLNTPGSDKNVPQNMAIDVTGGHIHHNPCISEIDLQYPRSQMQNVSRRSSSIAFIPVEDCMHLFSLTLCEIL